MNANPFRQEPIETGIREVLFIKDLVVDRFRTEREFIEETFYENEGENLLQPNVPVDIQRTVLVHKYRIKELWETTPSGTKKIFVAFSSRLNDYLVKPINAIIEENEKLKRDIQSTKYGALKEIKDKIAQFNDMSLFRKILFVIKGYKV